MGEKRVQAKWDCTSDGILSVLFPSGLKGEFDLTELYEYWTDFTEAEKFFSAYGVKQKLMDLSSDPKWTYQETLDRAKELFKFCVDNGTMPATKRAGGFGISKKKIAEKIEERETPLTEDQIAILKELGLM